MRSATLAALALVAVACSGGGGDTTTTSLVFLDPVGPLSTTTVATTAAEESEALEICPAPTAFPQVLPERVVAGVPETAEVEFDEFTVIEGAFTASQFDEAGSTVLVMIRGALPPRQFTAESTVVTVLNDIPAAVGPIGDGYWAAAWALPPGDRCDLYSLIFYPPVNEDEVAAVVGSLG